MPSVSLHCIFLSGVCIGEVSVLDEGKGGVGKDVLLHVHPLVITMVLFSITRSPAMVDMSWTGAGNLSRCW